MEQCQKTGIDTRIGVQNIDMGKVIHFPRGLMGFEDKRDFTLLRIRDDAPFLLLQSIDDADLGLLVADPFQFIDGYNARIGDAEQALLQAGEAHQVSVLVTVSIPCGKPENTTLNLTGPIFINHEARIGLQVPQSNSQGPSQVYLYKKDD